MSRAIALADRSFVGQEPAVPRKVNPHRREESSLAIRAAPSGARNPKQMYGPGFGAPGSSMVDWDLVDKRRAKGWDWDRIAADPKVGFHAEAVRRRARTRRSGSLYYQRRSKAKRLSGDSNSPQAGGKRRRPPDSPRRSPGSGSSSPRSSGSGSSSPSPSPP